MSALLLNGSLLIALNLAAPASASLTSIDPAVSMVLSRPGKAAFDRAIFVKAGRRQGIIVQRIRHLEPKVLHSAAFVVDHRNPHADVHWNAAGLNIISYPGGDGKRITLHAQRPFRPALRFTYRPKGPPWRRIDKRTIGRGLRAAPAFLRGIAVDPRVTFFLRATVPAKGQWQVLAWSQGRTKNTQLSLLQVSRKAASAGRGRADGNPSGGTAFVVALQKQGLVENVTWRPQEVVMHLRDLASKWQCSLDWQSLQGTQKRQRQCWTIPLSTQPANRKYRYWSRSVHCRKNSDCMLVDPPKSRCCPPCETAWRRAISKRAYARKKGPKRTKRPWAPCTVGSAKGLWKNMRGTHAICDAMSMCDVRE